MISNVIDGKDDDHEIAEVFADKYRGVYNSVPTCPEELSNLYDNINQMLCSEMSTNNCMIQVKDIEKAITSLKRGKDDGNYHLVSDHIMMSTNKFKCLFAMLLNCMLTHGYNPNDLLTSIITSIPKCARSSLNSSDNYRGITLCSSLCKAIDYVFIIKFKDKFKSSNLHFAFDEGHDTVMCTSMVKEIVSYYVCK